MQSLIGSFHYAQVPAVLLTRWRSDEEITTKILENFYDNIAKGMHKNLALELAKQKYLIAATDAKAHPFYWASLCLFGEVAALQTSKGNVSSSAGFWASSPSWVIGAVVLILAVGGGFFFWKNRQKRSAEY